MINFDKPTNENPYGKITATITEEISQKFKSPFKFECINLIDNEVKWSSGDLYFDWWSSYLEPCNTYVRLTDSDGNLIEDWTWETEKHGDYIHKYFLNWCKNNPGAKGIAIGTHDGTTGEWVVPTRSGLVSANLVEASEKQFTKLFENYKNLSNVSLNMSLITKDGGEIDFFECDAGFVNSTSKEHVLKFEGEARQVKKNSISLNDLIINLGLEKELRWLHLDVEGIDDELILSLDDSRIKLPEIIIYETLNLSEQRKKIVADFLNKKNYHLKEFGWNTIAVQNKLDLSLLVHTCDGYERFWKGMFYTLDFYWDYNSIPVYFANEEKKLNETYFDCRGISYKPDSRIRQILTGRSTDKTGFSNRFITAVEKIPTKYIIYLQEDMWLRRSISTSTIEKLILFMEETNASSLRIHAKLFYYEEYSLEPTGIFIEGSQIYKNVGKHILSHNATIWRKDYILKHQKTGEDPWVNEIAGSERMMCDNEDNYHYNIHWYCQPGISNNGEFSEEANVYAHIIDEMKFIELSNR